MQDEKLKEDVSKSIRDMYREEAEAEQIRIMLCKTFDDRYSFSVDELKDQIKTRLDLLIHAFNGHLLAWEKETGCKANFCWKFKRDGSKVLEISEIVMPILSPDTDESSKKAEEILSKSESIPLQKV